MNTFILRITKAIEVSVTVSIVSNTIDTDTKVIENSYVACDLSREYHGFTHVDL